jgi:hypothetical protein
MELLPDERRRLDHMEGALRAEEPRLASLFDMFTRLAGEDGKPPVEEQFLADGPWRADALARHRTRRRLHFTITLVLVALIAIVVAGLN